MPKQVAKRPRRKAPKSRSTSSAPSSTEPNKQRPTAPTRSDTNGSAPALKARSEKLQTIRLERFRQFADTTFHLSDFNVLVGPNNSGKTSLLHAIRAFYSLMRGHVTWDQRAGRAHYHRRYLSSVRDVVPTPDPRELWNSQQTGSPVGITGGFASGVELSVFIRHTFGQLHVSAGDLPAVLTESTIEHYIGANVAFIPGLVGVLVEEPYVTSARRNALAAQGRYSEIFRSSLRQLKEKLPADVSRINDILEELFSVDVSSIDFDMLDDEYVTVKYRERGRHFDISSSGAGLQQVIQILTYLYLSRPTVLLIDEPDAHLHSRLQGRLIEVFRKVAKDLDAQVFLSTHSLQLIDSASTNETIVVDSSKQKLAPIGNNVDLVSHLVDVGIVNNSALSRILVSKRIVVLEDSDLSILRRMDQLCETGFFGPASNAFVKSSHGVSNFVQYKELGEILSAVATDAVDVRFVRDRDGIPAFLDEAVSLSFAGQGLSVHTLTRHEIESYLISRELVQEALRTLGCNKSLSEIEHLILESANNIKSTARGISRKSAALVNRHFDGPAKWDKEALERETDKWFDALDLNNLDTVITVWPGKELLSEICRLIREQWGVQLTNGRLTSTMTKETVPHEIRTLFESLAGISTSKPIPSVVGTASQRGTLPRHEANSDRAPSADVAVAPASAAPAKPDGAVKRKSPTTKKKEEEKPRNRPVKLAVRSSKTIKASDKSLQLSAKEELVFNQLLRDGTQTLGKLAATCFPSTRAAQGNSWVRNSMRRLVRAAWVERVGSGQYRATAKGRAKVAPSK
ncbi:MAG: AAA family ATPase [Kofleriaceae bacterium]|nr:AAA family ATPase [Kofleriaceae bacterium]MCB9574665.1 AAA family ATPase [Kofleriaceae bacterium]